MRFPAPYPIHLLLAFLGLILGGLNRADAQAQPTAIARANYEQAVLPSLVNYCGDCHSGDQPAAGIAFESLDIRQAKTLDRATWKKVHAQIQAGIMPPPDSEQPTTGERELWLRWIDEHALRVVCTGPAYPGRVTLRRLNRNEYNRTIRDLVGIDYRPADEFPSDDVGYGFDNIGDVLTLPPVLLERYLDAADEVVRRAILVPEAEFAPTRSIPGKTLASVGEVGAEHHFSATAEYVLRVEAYGDQAGPEPAKMAFLLDSQSLQIVDVLATANQPGTYEHRLRSKTGLHSVAVKFLNDYYEPDHPDPKLRGDRNLHIRSFQVIGPIGVLPDELPESHHRLIPRPPAPKADRAGLSKAVRTNLARFLPRAFRRPVEPNELERFARIADLVLDDEASFERAMQVAVQAALVSPAFLFRIEKQPSTEDPEPIRRLDNFELATRLSYFLWAAPPDLPLLKAAAGGELDKPEVVRRQVRRMLADPRIEGLVEDFAGQWLQLRNLETISIDRGRFTDFTPELRTSMRRETELLFATIIKENRSVLELLSADFTFLDERLAKLYGIAEVFGDDFRRVSLGGTPRRGLLGQAAILTVTSNPTRTSPVKRGKWILDNLLAAPPPPAPPNVPALETESHDNATATTLRAQLELHRSKSECAACHRLMDPLGFGLENFDAIGRWREQDQGQDIDAQGELPDGSTFTGPDELRSVLLERQQEFRRCLASKLLTYALGRGLEFFDECTLNEITEGLEAEEDRFEALVWQIVKSRPFRFQARSPFPE